MPHWFLWEGMDCLTIPGSRSESFSRLMISPVQSESKIGQKKEGEKSRSQAGKIDNLRQLTQRRVTQQAQGEQESQYRPADQAPQKRMASRGFQSVLPALPAL